LAQDSDIEQEDLTTLGAQLDQSNATRAAQVDSFDIHG
jgi:hypothetical protein